MGTGATDLQLDEYRRQGQELYSQHKYQAALQRFNASIQGERITPLRTLDSRAATLVKLGDLPAALKDGKLMIEKYETSFPGYLRTGQILQLMKMDDVAENIYKLGLRKVPTTDPKRVFIQSAHDKLIRLLSPSEATDPLSILPVEIATMVVKYLNFRDIVTASGVSKPWHTFLCSIPELWSNLDLSSTRRTVPSDTIVKYIKRARGKVQQVKTSEEVSNRTISLIASKCETLAHLEILGGLVGSAPFYAYPVLQSLETLIVGAEIGLDTITQVFVHCSKLKRAEFRTVFATHRARWTAQCPELRSLTMISTTGAGKGKTIQLQLETLISKMPNLEELILTRWTCNPGHTVPNVIDFSLLKKLECLSLQGTDLLLFPILPQTLKTLDISGWSTADPTRRLENIYTASLPSLTSLNVTSSSQLPADGILRLLESNKGKVKKFGASKLYFGSAQSLRDLATSGSLAGITELGLSTSCLDDSVAGDLAANLPCLTRLNASATAITGVGIKALVDKPGSKLEKLNVDDCRGVGVDAVEYARSHGIQVSFFFRN